ncbi:MAG TPA: hypothetical protein VFU48_13515, partial [Nitrospira sp.]|nr:hypothetical protein [Nitrospira sp.]
MSRPHDEESELSEARRQTVDDMDASEPASVTDQGERETGRSEGLDTLKSYLREVRRSTLLTFK